MIYGDEKWFEDLLFELKHQVWIGDAAIGY